jgi:hypothetical protein
MVVGACTRPMEKRRGDAAAHGLPEEDDSDGFGWPAVGRRCLKVRGAGTSGACGMLGVQQIPTGRLGRGEMVTDQWAHCYLISKMK